MNKKYLILIVLAITFAFIRAGTASADGNVSIKINGQVRDFQPPAQIVASRTMVPLRFVAEDEAIQGEVAWEGTSQRVSVSCLGQQFYFYIGKRNVSVNDQVVYLDSPPYIFQGRTYIPLRFLAEHLGGNVGWNESKREVSIDFKSAQPEPPASGEHKTEVFAYYYGRVLQEFKDNADLFTDVAFRWFETNASGDLNYEYQDDYANVLKFARSQGIRSHASVVFMDKAGLHTLLSSKENRANLIANLLAEVKKNSYDGVNIDFEFIGAEDRDSFTAFLRELKKGLGDKELSVAVFACTRPESWLAAYDYAAIGNIADRIIVMAYDYSYKGSNPGPVAPLWWVNDVVDYLGTIVSSNKLLLGMPTYGYDWGDGLSTATVTAARLKALDTKYGLTRNFDDESMSPYYTYTDSDNVYHQIWLENEISLTAKLNVAIKKQLAGVSFWRIGNGFTDLYNVLRTQ